jgi:conjugative transposon TraM protein
LEAMLDKILDIQHPERVKERLTIRQKVNRKDLLSYQVRKNKTEPAFDFYPASNAQTDNAFWGLPSSLSATTQESQTFIAAIHENQKIQEGQSIKLRLLQDIFIDNIKIPKGSFVFGKSQLSEGRVLVTIQDISYNNMVFPVQLTVYDQTDGMEGINIQGDMTEEVSKNGMDQLIQQMQFNAMTSSVGVQAATSGIQTVKNLLSKKVKKTTVNLKAGHVLLLKPTQS